MEKLKTRDVALVGLFAALMVICAWISIPLGPVPVTLQTFAVFLAAALCCFGFATVLGWGLYGARCAQYLFGHDAWKLFAIAQVAIVVISAVLETSLVWSLAETLNGLMAIPNLIALVGLSPELVRLTCEYKTLCGK